MENVLRVGHETVLVVVLTTGGMREFVLYTLAPHNLETGISLLRAEFPHYAIQCYIEPDTDWDGYASFVDALA